MEDDEALKARVFEDFHDGRVGFHLLPGGHYGMIGLAVAVVSSIVSIWIVVSSLF